jgi:predicted hydrocarbon binding protein
MDEINFPARIMRRFVETLSSEVGHETFSAALSKAGFPEEWAHPEHFAALDDKQTAQAYSSMQSAMRIYYGRGARGILLRIGTKLWDHLLDDSSFGLKAQSKFIHALPKSLRPKPTLELLARILSATAGNVAVHNLDLDLLLVDQTSPTTLDQSDDSPICFVTFGLIRECLYWADGQVYDIEERTCRAVGARQCEFKITIGG